MFDNVLVPLDFSVKDEAALRAAAEMAGGDSGRITLLHVIETIEAVDPAELKDFYVQLEEKALARLQTLAGQLVESGLSVQQEIAFGKRAHEILRVSLEGEFDLILLSSHKLDPEHFQEGLGSISHQVSILAQCPVLLLR